VKHLTPEQLAELDEQLRHELQKLERSMVATDRATRPVTLDQTAVGRLSRMSSLESQGIAQGLQERERVKLGRIQGARARLESGTYGVCTDCGAEVPFGRLYVMPETPTCAPCGGSG
jgi:DnaK suppressor protein